MTESSSADIVETQTEGSGNDCPDSTANDKQTTENKAELQKAQTNDENKRQYCVDAAMQLPSTGFSISGFSLRLPKSDNMMELERNLYTGTNMIMEHDDSRFEEGLWGLPPRAGRLNSIKKFDAEFFGFSQDEANKTDHTLRILYEVVYESILDAGINPATLRGSRTGLFLGHHTEEFTKEIEKDEKKAAWVGYYGQLAVRVAQFLDIRGPVSTFDAACASSFVAMNTAMDALESGLIDKAIICGANCAVNPMNSFVFLQMQMLSPTGYCKFGDADGDGYAKAEGIVACLVEKDNVCKRKYLSILKTMTSIDGWKKEGITFPSDVRQEDLMRRTKEYIGLKSDLVQYVEAHGTGTPAGDPQECRSIGKVYADTKGAYSDDKRTIGPLVVGSIKASMGHAEGASGLASLAKVALMLENETIYKNLLFKKPNQNIEGLMDGSLTIPTQRTKLESPVIPVSCYGFGGTNVHIIARANDRPRIEDCPKLAVFDASHKVLPEHLRLVVMFGRNEQLLNRFFDKLLSTKHCITEDLLALIDSINATKVDRLMKARGFLVVNMQTRQQVFRSVSTLDTNEFVDQQALTEFNVNKQCVTAKFDLRSRGHMQESAPVKLRLEFAECASSQDMARLRLSARAWASLSPEFKNCVGRLSHCLSLMSDEPAVRKINLFELLLADKSRKAESGAEVMVASGAFQLAFVCFARHLFGERDAARDAWLHSATVANKSSLVGRLGCAFAKRLVDEDIAMRIVAEFAVALHEPKPGCAVPQNGGVERKFHELVAKHCGEELARQLKDRAVDERSTLAFELPRVPVIAVGPINEHASTFNGLYSGSTIINSIIDNKNLVDSEDFTQESKAVLVLLATIGSLYAAGFNYDLSKFYYWPRVQSSEDSIKFPVRKQTPSLSSLFEWDHDTDYFVPRYPDQFCKSSAKAEFPLDSNNETNQYLSGHSIEGRILFPATGYLTLVWRVFSFVQKNIFDASFQKFEKIACSVEITNVRLMRAIILGDKPVSIYLNYDCANGMFCIKEGGSVVCDGFARSPQTEGLLYGPIREHVRETLKEKQKQADDQSNIKLSKSDVYKLFRVCGYDYGGPFQNIEEATSDGSWCKIKYGGHFIALTDTILQSIFLSILNYAPSGSLFLPVGFDYVRFDAPAIIKKLQAHNHHFDILARLLDNTERREISKKMIGEVNAAQEGYEKTEEEKEIEEMEKKREEEEREKNKPTDCYFETYCDPLTGIIITDGVEMRGIKAAPAPRRTNNSDVLLESYQFVPDFEDPVQDELLSEQKEEVEKYVNVCDSLAINLVEKLDDTSFEKLGIKHFVSKMNGSYHNEKEVEKYLSLHLPSRYEMNCVQAQNMASANDEDTEEAKDVVEKYDIKKNGSKVLASILDELYYKANNSKKQINCEDVIEANKEQLAYDIIQTSVFKERYLRPIIEMIVEHVCYRKNVSRVKVLEINSDNNLLKPHFDKLMLISTGEAKVTVDYTVAHPNPEKLVSLKALESTANTQKMTDLDTTLKALPREGTNMIVFKDLSCYCLSQLRVEQNGLKTSMCELYKALSVDGFLLVCMRQKLCAAEQVILGLTSKSTIIADGEPIHENGSNESKFNRINALIESRCRLLLREAANNQLDLVAKKTNTTGSVIFLFHKKNLKKLDCENTLKDEASTEQETKKGLIHKVLHITSSSSNKIKDWLTILRGVFKPEDEEVKKDEEKKEKTPEEIEAEKKKKANEVPRVEADIVWLCGASTKNQPPTGVIGMMQALRKELGAKKLRCFVDNYSFKNLDSDSKISIADFENSGMFKAAKERDFLWNIVDETGRLGSYRHFTVNDCLSDDKCSCASPINSTLTSHALVQKGSQMNSQHVAKPAYINYATKGDLSSFAWFEKNLMNRKPGSRIVQVSYSSLNFRDVMFATGKLGLEAVPMEIALNDCMLGLEFSGVEIDKTGRPGRRVAGMCSGSALATHVLMNEGNSVLFEIPDKMSLEEASSIPVVYMTVMMSLIHRAKAQPGESILIHAGSGGVGQAAVRIAHHLGLVIYTTVGTKEKRQFMLEEFSGIVKDENMFSSRDTYFETAIMRKTKGRGVDIVLNSLADDKMAASIRCLAHGGRFCEIGKYDLSIDTKLELLMLEQNQTFHGIVLDKLFESKENKGAFREMVRKMEESLKEGLVDGHIKPIKRHVFARDKVEDAFRFMASGKHTGKVVLEICKESDLVANKVPAVRCVPAFALDSTKGYIVTGGLGGFGLELVKWLAMKGARHITVTTRSGIKTGYQKDTITRLIKRDNANIIVATEQMADASNEAGARKLIEMATRDCPSRQLGGVFHLAMVLKDALLENMTTEDFELVCKPKISICHWLDRVSRESAAQPDYFVVFSSVTSGKGNAGQCNYAYANSSTERICEQRRRDGLHGLAVQWGAIGDVGVAFENFGGNDIVIGGTVPQRMPSCYATLNRLLASPFSVCLSVVPENRGKAGFGDVKSDLVGAVLRVLGIKDRSKVDPKTTLGELGLDSLMAVEIRQYIEREYEMSLTIPEIRALTIERIQEINDSGAAKTKAKSKESSSTSAEDTKKVVSASYGSKIDPKQSNQDSGKPSIRAPKKLEIDREAISNFVPQLKLPSDDFVRLTSLVDVESSKGQEPLFFIPPIHGKFDQMEIFAKNLPRVCLGMNWTRELGQCHVVSAAVDAYVKVLMDYVTNNSLEKLDVTLVGYSYGAFIAFEVYSQLQKLHVDGKNRGLIPKKLILLDGSPSQFSIAKNILISLNNIATMKDSSDLKTLEDYDEDFTGLSSSEKLTNVVLSYAAANLQSSPYFADKHELYQVLSDVKSTLEETDYNLKIVVASELLVKHLRLEEDKSDVTAIDIQHAIEAFSRRYQILNNYESGNTVSGTCTLIRATDSFIKHELIKEDYNLSEIVVGKVNLFIFNGGHETFIEKNANAISKTIIDEL